MANSSLSKFHSFDNHRLFFSKIQEQNLTPRICVICIASFGLGLLHGTWIDPTQDVETICDEIKKMLVRSSVPDATEWTIYTYSGFGTITLDGFESIDLIHHKAIFTKTYGEWSLKLLEYYDDDIELAEEAIVDHYQGKYGNELEFATSLFDNECAVKIPEFAKLYIDYDSYRSDIFNNDYYSIEAAGAVHVFSNG